MAINIYFEAGIANANKAEHEKAADCQQSEKE
jgi:hypothetical protein